MDIIEKAVAKLGQSVKPAPAPAPTPAFEREFVDRFGSSAANPIATNPVKPLSEVKPLSAHTNGTQQARPAPRRNKRHLNCDIAKLKADGMIVPDGERSHVKEEYRRIKQPILANASGKGAIKNPYANLVMVTSSIPGEGKTYTAINLALSIASERDRTVLLIDADVLRASMSKFFNIKEGQGLVDYLIDENIELSDILISTDVPSLTLLPAGNTHHLSTELLSSAQMQAVAQELSQRYSDRIVILDSPPLLNTSEARVLAHLVGQIVMVVEAEQTPRNQVNDAFDLLRDLGPETSIGLVLNKTRRIRDRSYYYGYGYGYGYADSKGE